MDIKLVCLLVMLFRGSVIADETNTWNDMQTSMENEFFQCRCETKLDCTQSYIRSQFTALMVAIEKWFKDLSFEVITKKCDCCKEKPKDCQDIYESGQTEDGVYTIYPERSHSFQVRCNMTADGGGWTVIQRREYDTDFYKTWDEYVVGFGDSQFHNYWLGLEKIYALTNQATYELRVDLTSSSKGNAAAKYQVFRIGDNQSKYKLYVDSYSADPNLADPGDSLSIHSDAQFSTYDRDHDSVSENCASLFLGAWWYIDCHSSNLNGDWGNTNYAQGPVWRHFGGYYDPLIFTQMMIRKLQ